MPGLAQRHETHGRIEEHVRLIRAEIAKGLDDPATRVLAAAIVSGNFDSARDPRSGEDVPVVPFHGRWFRAAQSWEAARQVCGQRDYMCEVTAIWNFIVLNIRYTQDQDGEDTYCTLRSTLEQGAGDCDDLTIAFATLLKAVGFENVIARIVSVTGTEWEHIYPLVQLPQTRQWVALDCTELGHRPGWEYQGIVAHRDFAL